MSERRTLGVIAGVAVLLTAVVGILAAWIESAYLDRHSYFFDAASYQFYNVRLEVRLREESRFALAAEEYIRNDRHPARTLPILLLAPSLLAHRLGHLATAVPTLLAVLVLLGWTIYRRSGSIPYALAGMAVFAAMPGLYSPRLGFGAYWLDIPAAFLVLASALCLVHAFPSDHGGAGLRRRLAWLAGFALAASLAALCRYIAAVQIFVLGAPILAILLFSTWRREGSPLKTVILPVVLMAAIIGVLAGPFLALHAADNARFYATYGYSVGQGVVAAVFSTVRNLFRFSGIPLIGALVVLAGAQLAASRQGACNRRELAIAAWMLAAIPLFLILGVRAVGTPHSDFYAVPPLFAALLAPVSAVRAGSPRFTNLAAFACIVASLMGGYSAIKNVHAAYTPVPRDVQQKAFDRALAGELTKSGRPTVWNAFFDEYSWLPSMEAYYATGTLPMPAGQPFFNAHASAWKGDYPGLAPEEVARRVWAATKEWVDLAVVYDDPLAPAVALRLNNECSRVVARTIAEKVRSDSNWVRLFTLTDTPYGPLSGYRNTAAGGRAYATLLRSPGAVRP